LVPASLQEPFRACLDAALSAWVDLLGDRLVSVVLYGSVARGTAREGSDLDVLIVAGGLEGTPAERRGPLLDAWQVERAARSLPAIDWSLVTKTPAEASVPSPLYLDLVEDAVLLLDRGGFFAEVLAGLRARMAAMGSRRVFLPDGSWYWDLKPDFRWGEVVEL
jgi:predicted nucleotidyltransferase